MDVRAFFERLLGRWQGDYRLWLYPQADVQQSAVDAEIRPAAGGKYLLFTYGWEQGGSRQEGVFLLGGQQEQATATWGDSFHSAPEPMICRGSLADDGQKLTLYGNYSAGDETWGWRTELTREGNALVMQAFNITPAGQEGLAVRAEMTPAN